MLFSKKTALLLTTISLVLISTCTKDPGITISSPAAFGTAYGKVTPFEKPVRISLIRGTDTLATTIANTNTGEFTFRNIPYDLYSVYASNGIQYATQSYLRIESPVNSIYDMTLCSAGHFFARINPVPEDTLRPDTIQGDSLTTFCFSLLNSYGLIGMPYAYKTNPEILKSFTKVTQTSCDYYFSIPKIKLFTYPEITITVFAHAFNAEGIDVPDSQVCHYFLDSSGLARSTSLMLLKQYFPENAQTNVMQETPITIEFARQMNCDSIEKSISVSPVTPASFSWSNNKLTITPANALKAYTEYTLKINTTAMTLDSVHFGTPYEINFTTGIWSFFNATWPSDQAINIPLRTTFRFSSLYSIEPELLQSAFSISPPVDSLNFKMDTAGIVTISHAALFPDTTYQIVIDESCQSRKGVFLGKDLSISFRTISH